MANVNIKFNNKDYLLSCDDGQEENLKELYRKAVDADAQINELKKQGHGKFESIFKGNELFAVNATNSTQALLDASNLTMTDSGQFELYYQKRVIDSSLWVNESIPVEQITISEGGDKGWLPFASPIWAILAIGLAGIRRNERFVSDYRHSGHEKAPQNADS